MHHIAIHELAHHVHFTEFDKVDNCHRVHGKELYSIYNALCVFAAEKRLYKPNLYDKIDLANMLNRKV